MNTIAEHQAYIVNHIEDSIRLGHAPHYGGFAETNDLPVLIDGSFQHELQLVERGGLGDADCLALFF